VENEPKQQWTECTVISYIPFVRTEMAKCELEAELLLVAQLVSQVCVNWTKPI